MFKQLSDQEEKEFREFVDEDPETIAFIKKVSFYHPVIRDEIIKRIQQGK